MSFSKRKIYLLVSLLVLSFNFSCRKRSEASDVAGEKDESKTESFESYFTQKLSTLSPENKETLSKLVKGVIEGYAALSREALLKQAIELYAEIYVKNQKELDVNNLSEPEKIQLTQACLKYASIRHIFDRRSKSDPAYKNIVRDLFNKTAGQRFHVVLKDGQKQKVEYLNYDKIPFERFDDVRVNVSNMSFQQMQLIGALFFSMTAVIAGFGLNQEGSAVRQPVGTFGYFVAASSAFMAGVLILTASGEESEE